MDLGATLCTPRRPACGLCPVVPGCGRMRGLAEALPRREAKAERPTRRGVAFVPLRDDGAVLLRERPLKGLLGGMLRRRPRRGPSAGESGASALDHAPLKAHWREVPGLVRHTFTHFHLELPSISPRSRQTPSSPSGASQTLPLGACPRLSQPALPSVMRKVIAHALEEKSG